MARTRHRQPVSSVTGDAPSTMRGGHDIVSGLQACDAPLVQSSEGFRCTSCHAYFTRAKVPCYPNLATYGGTPAAMHKVSLTKVGSGPLVALQRKAWSGSSKMTVLSR